MSLGLMKFRIIELLKLLSTRPAIYMSGAVVTSAIMLNVFGEESM